MEAKAKKFAKFGAGVLLTILVVNTLAKHVPVVAKVNTTVKNGL